MYKSFTCFEKNKKALHSWLFLSLSHAFDDVENSERVNAKDYYGDS